MSVTPSTVVDQAYRDAKRVYTDAEGTYLAGHTYIIVGDSDRELLKRLDRDRRFEVRPGPETTLHLDFPSGESVVRDREAYGEFLTEMQAAGRLTDARVYKPVSLR